MAPDTQVSLTKPADRVRVGADARESGHRRPPGTDSPSYTHRVVRPGSDVAAAGATGPVGDRAGGSAGDQTVGRPAGGPTDAGALDDHERGQLSRLRR